MSMRAGLIAIVGVAIAVAINAVSPLSAQEPEPARTLTPGKGVEITTARCVICHDAQHITRAKLSRDEWAYNIKNMIERGAPIAQDEIPATTAHRKCLHGMPPCIAAAGRSIL
jgi:cytochrome c5